MAQLHTCQPYPLQRPLGVPFLVALSFSLSQTIPTSKSSVTQSLLMRRKVWWKQLCWEDTPNRTTVLHQFSLQGTQHVSVVSLTLHCSGLWAEMDPGLQAWPHQCWTVGKDHLTCWQHCDPWGTLLDTGPHPEFTSLSTIPWAPSLNQFSLHPSAHSTCSSTVYQWQSYVGQHQCTYWSATFTALSPSIMLIVSLQRFIPLAKHSFPLEALVFINRWN